MPRPRNLVVYRGKAMHRDERGWPPALLPPIQFRNYAIVIRREDLATASLLLSFGEPDISRNARVLTHFSYRSLGARLPIAVDDEARIVLPDDHRVQRVTECIRDCARADIPCYVALAIHFVQAEHFQTARKIFPRMIANDDER